MATIAPLSTAAAGVSARSAHSQQSPVSAAPLHVVAVASPVYWPDPSALQETFAAVSAYLEAQAGAPLRFHLIADPQQPFDVEPLRGATGVIVPLSGGVQPALIPLREAFAHAAILNAYLPGVLPDGLSGKLMHRNAHPASTDFFAHCRLGGHPVAWLSSAGEFTAYARAHAACEALRHARFLQIGQTEPWVINSCRDPRRFAEVLGCEVLPHPAEELYEAYRAVAADDPEVVALAEDWWAPAREHVDAQYADAIKACRVAVAMKQLLAKHEADALAMACFAMIGELDTTSCLALATLNAAARTIGACEGDLDAMVTLYLLKHLGCDFVWIANPIIHPENFVDLAHCTAPRCACGEVLSYRLQRHHESGRGVAPEVKLPGDREVTLARIGANLTELCVHPGTTESVPKQPTCHTQIRVHIPSTEAFLDNLAGTHVVMTYGDWRRELAFCAEFLGLKLTGSSRADR